MTTRRVLASLVVCALGILFSCSHASAAPPPRFGHSAVYDVIRDRMLVFGGNDGFDNMMNDVWLLPLSGAPHWSPLATAGSLPARRANHSAVFDPLRDRMLVFGGNTEAGAMDDLWALTFSVPATWTQLTPAGTPPSARAFHSAVYDLVRDRVLVFGGLDAEGPRHDVWALSLSGGPEWQLLPVTGTPPSDRFLQSAIYDPERDRLLVFGGTDLFHYDNDCVALNLGGGAAEWTPLTTAGAPPVARDGHGAIYDPVGDRMIVFGGWARGIGPTNDVWELSLAGTPTWAALACSGGIPNRRSLASTVLDVPRNRLLVFGGFGNGDFASFDDTWGMSLAGAESWTALIPGLDVPLGAQADLLGAPTPNPCRDRLSVPYALSRAGRVRIGVYDVNGRLVRSIEDGDRPAGPAVATWDGAGADRERAGPGVYFLRMTCMGFSEARRVVVVR
jgi:Kelch motif protein/flagellar hook capping protein FlgD/galactose oxidase-like protein